MYFESHAHYDDERFDEDRDTLLASFPAEGIETVVNASSDIKSSKASIALSEKYPFFYAAVGVHPHEVDSITEADINELRELSKHPKVVAIGEIGLDYYYDLSPRDLQLSLIHISVIYCRHPYPYKLENSRFKHSSDINAFSCRLRTERCKSSDLSVRSCKKSGMVLVGQLIHAYIHCMRTVFKVVTVSYTHLDVYKRQACVCNRF